MGDQFGHLCRTAVTVLILLDALIGLGSALTSERTRFSHGKEDRVLYNPRLPGTGWKYELLAEEFPKGKRPPSAEAGVCNGIIYSDSLLYKGTSAWDQLGPGSCRVHVRASSPHSSVRDAVSSVDLFIVLRNGDEILLPELRKVVVTYSLVEYGWAYPDEHICRTSSSVRIPLQSLLPVHQVDLRTLQSIRFLNKDAGWHFSLGKLVVTNSARVCQPLKQLKLATDSGLEINIRFVRVSSAFPIHLLPNSNLYQFPVFERPSVSERSQVRQEPISPGRGTFIRSPVSTDSDSNSFSGPSNSRAKSRLRRQFQVNHYAPVFDQPSYSVNVLEHVALDSEVYNGIHASDRDDDGRALVSYRLTAVANSRSLEFFRIDSDSGIVYASGDIDREDIGVHSFDVEASDEGPNAHITRVRFTVTVIDVNDHAPKFEKASYNASRLETRNPGGAVLRVVADDEDSGPNKVITYAIVRGNEAGAFRVVAGTGQIIVATPLDREETSRYDLVVRATDGATDPADQLSTDVNVTIHILDDNDNSPQFVGTPYVVTVSEDITLETDRGMRTIGSVLATDADAGDYGDVRYSIFRGNPNPEVFHLNETTGALTLERGLNREAPGGDEYELIIRAEDRGVPPERNSTVFRVIVGDVNDNEPSFPKQTYSFEVSEDTGPPHDIFLLAATDDDSGENARLTYTLALVDPSDVALPFMINSSTGQLTLADQLDREVVGEYSLEVTAEDHGDPVMLTTVPVVVTVKDVNDNPPMFDMEEYRIAVPENKGVGSTVLTVTASDADLDDTLTYAFSTGNGAGDFSIAADTSDNKQGIISVAKTLEYERTKEYEFLVQVSDASGKVAGTRVGLRILDENRHLPMFNPSRYSVSVYENATSGALVTTVMASDDDIEENGRILYEPLSWPEGTPFEIDSESGEVKVVGPLDRETQSSYSLDVSAKDHGIPPLDSRNLAQIRVTILDVNDFAPRFSESAYSGSISEEEGPPASVLSVTATDADEPDSPNSLILYSFGRSGNGNGSFSIASQLGTIHVASKLDRETTEVYHLIVVACDNADDARLCSSVNVTLTVQDINDNAPVFESGGVITRYVFENATVGTVVLPPVIATDADIGENANLVFRSVGGDETAFRMEDRLDGTVVFRTLALMDYESLVKSYSVDIEARSGTMIARATVTFVLLDVNDNKPVLSSFVVIVNFVVNSGHFPEGAIGRVPAFDADVSDRPLLRYKFIRGNDANLLTLDRKTGEISLNKFLNSDRPNNATFTIQVSDSRNDVEAQCELYVRPVTEETIVNSVTLRVFNVKLELFMTSLYSQLIQGLSAVLLVEPQHIYVINIKNGTDWRPTGAPSLNITFSVLSQSFGSGEQGSRYLSNTYLREKLYVNFPTLSNRSALRLLPFEDDICLKELCEGYERCTTKRMIVEALPFVSSAKLLFRPISTRDTLQCTCPQGFAGMNESYTCDKEINNCYSSPCENGATCVHAEGTFHCLCTDQYAGTLCEHAINSTAKYSTATCPRDACGENARCVGLIQGGWACEKLDGTRCPTNDFEDEFCRMRSASFSPGQYLLFNGLQQRSHFTISLRFATRRRDGLLFYDGRFDHRNDFVALEIINHQLRFSFSTGNHTESVVVTSAGGVTDGNWKDVRIRYEHRRAVLSVGADCDPKLALMHPGNFSCAAQTYLQLPTACNRMYSLCHRYLDLTGPLLIGGVPHSFDVSPSLASKDFVGCMEDFRIDGELLNFNGDVLRRAPTPGCKFKGDFCSDASSSYCSNGGSCLSGWLTSSCACVDGFTGSDCSEEVERSHTVNAAGYLQYDLSSDSVPSTWYMGFGMRTQTRDCLLLKINMASGSALSYLLADGSLAVQFDSQEPVVFSSIRIDTGRWHSVEASLTSGSGSSEDSHLRVTIDFNQYSGSAKLPYIRVGARLALAYAGGSIGLGNGFVGCIKGVHVGAAANTYLRSFASRGAVQGCVDVTACDESSCRTSDGSTSCRGSWGDGRCACNKGYLDPDLDGTCTDVCSLSPNPCLHGGTCLSTLTSRQTSAFLSLSLGVLGAGGEGFVCTCPPGYTGRACELKVEQSCPAGWYRNEELGVCGPCNCDTSRGFAANCHRKTGECECLDGYYRVSERRCALCQCDWEGGAKGRICDKEAGQCPCRSGVIGRRCDQCEHPSAEVTENGCTIVYGQCPRTHSEGIWWPTTPYGLTAYAHCPTGSAGIASRRCVNNDQIWMQPSLDNCTSEIMNSLLIPLNALEKSSEANLTDPIVYQAYSASVKATIAQLSVITAQYREDGIAQTHDSAEAGRKMYTNDLNLLRNSVQEIVNRETTLRGLNLSHTHVNNFLQQIVDTVDLVFDARHASQWARIQDNDPTALPQLVTSLEEYVRNLALNMAVYFHYKTSVMYPVDLVGPRTVLGLDMIASETITLENEPIDSSADTTAPPGGGDGEDYGIVIPKYNTKVQKEDMFDKVTSVSLPGSLFPAALKDFLTGELVTQPEVAVGYIYYGDLSPLLLQSVASPPLSLADSVTNSRTSDNSPSLGSTNSGSGGDKDNSGVSVLNSGWYPASVVVSVVVQQGADPLHSVSAGPGQARPVRIYFKSRVEKEAGEYRCVFLKKEPASASTKEQYSWSDEGCRLAGIRDDIIVCECNHLSTFTVLATRARNMTMSPLRLHSSVLVCVPLSCVCLLFVLVIYCFQRDLDSNKVNIHINLLLCLLVSLLVFVVGVDRSGSPLFCTVVSVALQFFCLCTFSWLFVDFFHLLRMITEIRNVDRGPMKFYYLLGYVVPGLTVGLAVGLSASSFGTPTMCWVSVYNTAIWSLAGPAIFTVVLTVCVGAFATYQYCRGRATNHKNGSSFRMGFRGAAILLPLLVAMWTLGILVANEREAETLAPPIHGGSPVFGEDEVNGWHVQYGFAIVVLLLGVVMALSHVVFDPQAKKEIRRRIAKLRGEDDSRATTPRSNQGIGQRSLVGIPGPPFRELTSPHSYTESTISSLTKLSLAADGHLIDHVRHPSTITSSQFTNGLSSAPDHVRSRRRRDSDQGDSDSESDISPRGTGGGFDNNRMDLDLASSLSSDEEATTRPPLSTRPISLPLKPASKHKSTEKPPDTILTEYNIEPFPINYGSASRRLKKNDLAESDEDNREFGYRDESSNCPSVQVTTTGMTEGTDERDGTASSLTSEQVTPFSTPREGSYRLPPHIMPPSSLPTTLPPLLSAPLSPILYTPPQFSPTVSAPPPMFASPSLSQGVAAPRPPRGAVSTPPRRGTSSPLNSPHSPRGGYSPLPPPSPLASSHSPRGGLTSPLTTMAPTRSALSNPRALPMVTTSSGLPQVVVVTPTPPSSSASPRPIQITQTAEGSHSSQYDSDARNEIFTRPTPKATYFKTLDTDDSAETQV